MTRGVFRPSAWPPIANRYRKPGGDSTFVVVDRLCKVFGDRVIVILSETHPFIVAFAKRPSNRLHASRRKLGSQPSWVQARLCFVCVVGISPVAAGDDVWTADVDLNMSSWIRGRSAAYFKDCAQKELGASTKMVDVIACAAQHDKLMHLMRQMQRPLFARRRGRNLAGTIRQYGPLFIDDSVVGLKCRQDSSVQFVDVECLDDGQPCQLSRRPVLSENVVTARGLPSDPIPSVVGSFHHVSTVADRLELQLDRPEQSSLVGPKKVLESLHQVLPTVLDSSQWTVKNAMLADESLCLFRLTATASLGATL